MDIVSKTWLNAAKAASKKAVKQTAESTGKLIGNKIAEKIVKPKPASKVIISYSTREKARYTIWFKTSILKKEHHKISNLLNDSTVSEIVTRKWIDVNDLSNSQYSMNKAMGTL